MNFSERLLRLREERRLSQAELGEAVGASGPTIHRWEKGSGEPSLKQAVELARILDVDLRQLAYDDPPASTEDLPEDEATVLLVYRSLKRATGIDKDLAVSGLAHAVTLKSAMETRSGEASSRQPGVGHPATTEKTSKKKGTA